jgi:hypothetical protein
MPSVTFSPDLTDPMDPSSSQTLLADSGKKKKKSVLKKVSDEHNEDAEEVDVVKGNTIEEEDSTFDFSGTSSPAIVQDKRLMMM